jgi:glycosyltransferase involved in cell wall biosynthesis
MSDAIETYLLPTAFVSRDPNILLIGMDIGSSGFARFPDGSTSIDHIARILGEGGHLIVNPWWYAVGNAIWDERLGRIAEIFGDRRATHAHFFCNCPTEVAYIRENFGIDALLLSHNNFVQDRKFRVETRAKTYLAVYNAKVSWVKRHWLAEKVNNVAMIYPPYSTNEDHFRWMKHVVSGGRFLNGDPFSPDYKYFSSEQVCDVLNSARVGLCLSEQEGAMYASIEYLLCGLPVVSTRNTGGRDQYFDDLYCRTVEADPEAIAAAVEELAAQNFDPHLIRARTMAKIEAGREKFIAFIDAIQRANGKPAGGAAALERIMDTPWAIWVGRTIPQIGSEYQACAAAAQA